MEKEEVLEKLSKFSDIRLDEKTHTYYKGNQIYTSVSHINKRFIQDFDTDTITERTAIKRGVEKQDLIDLWEAEKNYSNWLGHFIHKWIEDYYNKIYRELPNDPHLINRINKFNNMFASHLHKLTPIAFEKIVYLEDKKIAGTIDSLFLFKGKLYMIDWKTNKKIKTDNDNHFNMLLPPFENEKENELNKYSLQQSMYSIMLERVGLKVEKKLICYLGETESKFLVCKDYENLLKEQIKTF